MSADERAALHDYLFDASDGRYLGESGSLPDDLPPLLISVRHYSQEQAAAQIDREPDAYRASP